MSRTYKDSPKSKGPGRGRQRNISVRAVRRDPPDLRKLSRALINLAMAEAAAEADAGADAAGENAAAPAEQPETTADQSAINSTSEVDHD